MIEKDGLLFIGDPHLEARIPGFRKDDYPQVAVAKFAWCLKYARTNNLQPILLGDLFHLPQDNPNWLLARIIETISDFYGAGLPAIHGNHDVRENTRKPNDSVSILFAGGHLRLLSEDAPWIGTIDGRRVVVGGTVWGERLPKEFLGVSRPPENGQLFADESEDADLVAWITHHDILIPGYEEAGRIRPKRIPGIDLIVNGHVHRRLEPVRKDGTNWITAGNITRRARSDASRAHIPAVVCVVPPTNTRVVKDDAIEAFEFESQAGVAWSMRWVRVPHEPFDDVFHPEVIGDASEEETADGSAFIADLRELTQRKTDSGAGLITYLEQNVSQFDAEVADEIMRLAAEVTHSTQ
ncbi:metallophosphoesterase [Aporhodopirellula aestuarii]|uniref:Metallophosphoesterase n=1 Tax=Aporhodopirellula aestuarii TaxID=2950107 RepID=A0ABT0TXN2_9BACT|nr:metallophosphoesterase [Aporhodopirellula aestuarii]MCM2369345.1 metallophosphoesterase [Aporhodopirellula aestuarii]